VVRILALEALPADGDLPRGELREKLKLPYQERKLGIRRSYEARQNQIHAERVIRVPAPVAAEISTQDAAETENGVRYRIDLVQRIPDAYPPCLDLTLAAYTQAPGEDTYLGGDVIEP
jgi:hypothetical protein